MLLNNPFLITGYHSPKYFCDRKLESNKIIDALHNGRNITLIAPRRIGKTGLIKNVFYHLKEQNSDIITIYLDIYSTQNLNDLIALMANKILGALDTTSQAIMKRVTTFIKSCKPIFSIDEITGKLSVSLDIQPNHEIATLKEIFEYLGSSEKRCYIAIDEFQQISDYPESGVEALLRSYIQFIPNINFIFSGSSQHVMRNMFLSAKRPFYQSTQIITIDRIDKSLYYDFANEFFSAKGIELESEIFDYYYDRFSGHTWYIQAILNRLYSSGYTSIDSQLVEDVVNEIIEESYYSYQALLSAYSINNVRLLKAIAKEGIVSEITSSAFIAKYKLGAVSSVRTSLKKLMDQELAYKTDNGYIVYDRFMAIWLKAQP